MVEKRIIVWVVGQELENRTDELTAESCSAEGSVFIV
jgi:hypothetical protein